MLWRTEGNVVAMADMDGQNIRKMDVIEEGQMPDGLAIDFIGKSLVFDFDWSKNWVLYFNSLAIFMN